MKQLSTESSKIKAFERRLDILKKIVDDIKERVGILPKTVKPFTWSGLTELDKQILRTFLDDNLEDNALQSTSGIAKKLGINRTKIWRSLKRIMRISKALHGYPLLKFEPTFKKWSLNQEDFDIKREEEVT